MKKLVLLALCISLAVLSGCSSKYKRISYNKDTLGDKLIQYIDQDTQVSSIATDVVPVELPIYKISERRIENEEVQQMKQNLGIPEFAPGQTITLEGNKLVGTLADYMNTERGYFDMTDEEVEKLAWEVLDKIPFLEGTYEYLGIKSTYGRSDGTGEHIVRAGVSFRRVMDDVRIVGNDKCYLYFDGSGLVEFSIELYQYEKIGTMDVVPLQDAYKNIKRPDEFTIEGGAIQIADSLNVEQVKLLLVNQYSRGCTILQPVYNFIGTATDSTGASAEFNSLVIAIPESYTYEEE